jgi:hypothetical protein
MASEPCLNEKDKYSIHNNSIFEDSCLTECDDALLGGRFGCFEGRSAWKTSATTNPLTRHHIAAESAAPVLQLHTHWHDVTSQLNQQHQCYNYTPTDMTSHRSWISSTSVTTTHPLTRRHITTESAAPLWQLHTHWHDVTSQLNHGHGAFHYMKHGHVCLSLHETWRTCVPFIMWNMAMCAFHYMEHGHVCLSSHETWTCVPFITWNMDMCAFHYMKHGHVCLSLREILPCVPFITWNMSMCAFHYMTHISLQAVMFIITILIITFMHAIYNYVPDTNHFSRLYSVAALLQIQFMLHVMLFCPWNMFCTFTSAPPAVCG